MRKFDEELEELKSRTVEMGELAREMLRKAVKSLKERDVELAEEVISKKGELASMDQTIEEKALRMIALYQPVASDMRTIATVLKIITYLSRVGRYGKDIAVITKELSREEHLAKLINIPYMAEMVDAMLGDAMDAFITGDITLLENLAEKDDTLDALRWSIFRECVTYMIEDPKNITKCAHYIMIAKYLERCGDHACKIAEKVHYMATGEHVEIK